MSYRKELPNNYTEEGGYIISPPDRTLIIVTIFLVIIGIMAIFSAGSSKAVIEGLSPLHFTVKQLIWLAAGICAAIFFTKHDYKKLKKYAMPFSIFVLILLILVQFTQFGLTVNGAKRWFVCGPLQFQPSEFAKPAVILMFASIFCKNLSIFDAAKFPYYIVFAIMLLFVYKQPNLSMIILLFATALVIYYMSGGGSAKQILLGILALGGAVSLFIKDYQKQRILVWLDPNKDPLNSGYNIIQSLIAFASGGFFGVGYGNSKQKLSWLPEGHTDFIFAVIAEEFGFLGSFFIICLFAMFVQRGFVIAARSPDMFGKLVSIGITFSIGFQALMNISVASSALPATGIPLPFISYGGSSLFISLCMLGVLLNISKKRVQRIKPYDEQRYI
ncbi:MAG: putative lipid II flippase FtsW [Candidatus Gastranaerophilales bacterium]|nr:putative lipid II flippase FtsW [Candidatus Gastranaerophilales bacterium]